MTVPTHRPDAPGVVDAALVLDGAHGHGYLVTGTDVPAPPDVTGWRHPADLLDGLVLHLHPRTVLGSAEGVTGTVVLLGHPVDVAAGITDPNRIASRLCASWDLQEDAGLVREAATLGGRWTLLARRRPTPTTPTDRRPPPRPGPDLLVVPDAHATQPVFWATTGGRLALGSTPSLAAHALDLPEDDDALRLLEELRARRPGAVTYLPGVRTAYLGLSPLVPNCLLRVDLSPLRVEHRRFWPEEERVERTDVESVYDVFRERLGAHVGLLAGLGRPALSLTAGRDSRVTAALAHEEVRAGGGLAFTYVNPRDARTGPAAAADVTGASAVAAQLGLPHRVLRWRQPPAGGTFDVLHRRTYDPLVPSRGAAHAMWADLPADLVQLQSNGAETGTTFVRRRTDEPLDPLRLARMMMHAADGLEDLAARMYDGYLEHAELTPDRLRGYDHHDLFYWEQRMGRWGWQKFTDGDLGHRVLAPFNDRVLLETMLSLPYAQREAMVLLDRVLDDVPGTRVRAPGPRVSLARSVTTLLPGRVRRRVEPVVDRRAARAAVSRSVFPGGYAVLPAGARGTRVPAGWLREPLPDGAFGASGALLRHHPGLRHAVVGDGSAWVAVLGDPVWVRQELDGAWVVARALRDALADRRSAEALMVTAGHHGLTAVVAGAAGLTGRYLVLAGDGTRTVVVPDPLTALGVHLLEDGSGVVSHARLADGPARRVSPGDLVTVAGGSLDVAPLDQRVDLASLARPRRVEDPATAAERLARHARILSHRGPAWLAMSGLEYGRSGELLPHLVASGGSALTWWDRTVGDDEAAGVFSASREAFEAGVQHRVLGLREDPAGGAPGSGASPALRAAREAAVEALRQTWGEEAEGVLPVTVALDAALPADAVVWFGTAPGPDGAAPHSLVDRPWELLQGARAVALPFSDRLLGQLP
ncbi:hypothetical protein [Ornithinimicrobium cerasi]|uniref:Uncharacterized protein n=1 Tax=Ornithinimicrobium cerasi TaxID=2248773 RepID=A0A285VVP4_9MICO|nr:hypothetical protein [Ornithinimicrobium cerasi]SOC58092.1 hypothetical protein SAMN05421879_1229 [Ornithinimicrobium cerasi]